MVGEENGGDRFSWSADPTAVAALFTRSGLRNVGTRPPQEVEWLPAIFGAVEPWSAVVRGSTPSAVGEGRDRHDLGEKRFVPRAGEGVTQQVSDLRMELTRVRSRDQAALLRAGTADRLEAELEDTRATLKAIEQSATYRFARQGSLVLRRLMPAESPQRRLGRRLLHALLQRGG